MPEALQSAPATPSPTTSALAATWSRFRTLHDTYRRGTPQYREKCRALGRSLIQVRTRCQAQNQPFDQWLRHHRFAPSTAYRLIKLADRAAAVPPPKPRPPAQLNTCFEVRGPAVCIPMDVRCAYVFNASLLHLVHKQKYSAAQILSVIAHGIVHANVDTFFLQQLARLRQRRDLTRELLFTFKPVIIPIRV